VAEVVSTVFTDGHDLVEWVLYYRVEVGPQPQELQEVHPPLPAKMKRAAREWPPFRVTQSSLVTLPPPDAFPAAIHLHGNHGPSDRSPLVNPFRTCATIYSSVNSSSQTIIFPRNRCPLFPFPIGTTPLYGPAAAKTPEIVD